VHIANRSDKGEEECSQNIRNHQYDPIILSKPSSANPSACIRAGQQQEVTEYCPRYNGNGVPASKGDDHEYEKKRQTEKQMYPAAFFKLLCKKVHP
jgi:hypothetical protein